MYALCQSANSKSVVSFSYYLGFNFNQFVWTLFHRKSEKKLYVNQLRKNREKIEKNRGREKERAVTFPAISLFGLYFTESQKKNCMLTS